MESFTPLIPDNSAYHVFMVVVAIVGSFSSYVQAYTMYCKKASGDVSRVAWGLPVIGNIFWFVYALMLGDSAIVVSSVLPLIGSSIVVVLTYTYPSGYEVVY